jgi:catechol 2,3-dioxygenase-like lactoylglutathione lyase family enzyme
MEPDLGWPEWIGVVCKDLRAQRRFYRDVLGLTEVKEGPDSVHFDLGGGRQLELLQQSGEPEYELVRYQVGFSVPDIEAASSQLAARGVASVSPIRGTAAGGQWCYFRDPEGNVFELKARRRR